MEVNLFIFNFSNNMINFIAYKVKNNPYIVFLRKLFFFFVLIFLLDYSIGNILKYFYFRQDSGLQYRTTYSIEKTKADILIFGSSRANHHYDPRVFEKRLNFSFYNAGRDGNYILYHLAVLKAVLKRYSPKIVILDFVADEFQKNEDSYSRLSSLLPYYKSHTEIRSIIELKSRFEKVKLLSSIYPYNSSLFTIAVGNTEFNKKRSEDIQGYVPLTRVWNETIQADMSLISYEIDSNKIKAYESFIHNCIKSEVKLYIVCSPYFIRSNHINYSVKIGQEIAKKYNIDFFDYSRDSVFINNSKLFADILHLNEKGAKVFSNLLMDNIENIMIRNSK